MTYDFTFEFVGDDEVSAKALTSLYRWFREDMAAESGTEVELVANTEPGRMGAADVLCTVLTQVTAISSLAVAFAAWRDARSSAPRARIRFGEATLELADASAEQLAVALQAMATTSGRAAPTIVTGVGGADIDPASSALSPRTTEN